MLLVYICVHTVQRPVPNFICVFESDITVLIYTLQNACRQYHHAFNIAVVGKPHSW
jgi:hypothetical protein